MLLILLFTYLLLKNLPPPTVNKFQANLENFSIWCINKKPSINERETQIMLLGNRKTCCTEITQTRYLQLATSYKYLGVSLNPTLSFAEHSTKTIRLVYMQINSLSHLQHSLETKRASCWNMPISVQMIRFLKIRVKREQTRIFTSLEWPYAGHRENPHAAIHTSKPLSNPVSITETPLPFASIWAFVEGSLYSVLLYSAQSHHLLIIKHPTLGMSIRWIQSHIFQFHIPLSIPHSSLNPCHLG